MTRLLILLYFALSAILSGHAQNWRDFNGLVANAEIGGAAWQYSGNIEHAFLNTNRLTFNARLGFGIGTVNSGKKRTYIGIPIGINLFTGQGNHHPELGLNIAYVQGRTDEGDPSKEVYLVTSIGIAFNGLRRFFRKVPLDAAYKNQVSRR